MTNRYSQDIRMLNVINIFVLFMIFLTVLIPGQEKRFIILTLAFGLTSVAYSKICFINNGYSKKYFSYLCYLWITKTIIFLFYEISFTYFNYETPDFVGVLDLYLLLALSLTTFFSYIAKFPYFYDKVESNIYRNIGIVGFLASVAISVQISRALIL